MRIPRFAVILFFSSLLLKLAAALIIKTPVESDFRLQYDAAQMFAAGDFSFGATEYFQRWGGQTGLVIIYGILLKIWNSLFFLKAVNCVAAAITNVLVYLIAREFAPERGARLTAALYMLFLFPATFVSVLSNQHLQAPVIFFALYLIIGKRFLNIHAFARYVLSGALIALGNAIRPDAIVALASVCLYFAMQVILRFSLKKLTRAIKRIVIISMSYFLVTALLSQAVIALGINSAGLKTNDPLLKFVYGLDTVSEGAYNQADNDRIDALTDSGMTRTEAELLIIKEQLKSPPAQLAQLVFVKNCSFWLDRGIIFSFFYISEAHPVLYRTIYVVDLLMFLFIAVMFAISAYKSVKGGKYTPVFLFFSVVFVTFCVYQLIEVQARYAYFVQAAVFIAASPALGNPITKRKQLKNG